jgi:hypothetical protein
MRGALSSPTTLKFSKRAVHSESLVPPSHRGELGRKRPQQQIGHSLASGSFHTANQSKSAAATHPHGLVRADDGFSGGDAANAEGSAIFKISTLTRFHIK